MVIHTHIGGSVAVLPTSDINKEMRYNRRLGKWCVSVKWLLTLQVATAGRYSRS